MERLTKRITENTIELSAKANPLQYNDYPQIVHMKHPFWNVFNRLCEYEDDEEQGLLFRISCPEGSEVYVIDYIYECKHNFECPLSLFEQYKCEEDLFCEHTYKEYFVKPTKFNREMEKFIGETVFLTKEEAEKKLAEMEGN